MVLLHLTRKRLARTGKLKASRGDILGVAGAHEIDEIMRGIQGEHERQELAGARDPV